METELIDTLTGVLCFLYNIHVYIHCLRITLLEGTEKPLEEGRFPVAQLVSWVGYDKTGLAFDPTRFSPVLDSPSAM